MESLVIKNALLCDHQKEQKSDILIQRGKIAQIGDNLQGDCVINASNSILLPSCIDLNVKAKSCTQSDLLTLEKKALKGGVGAIALSLGREHIEFLKFFNTQSHISFLASSIPFAQESIQELSKMHHSGALSISIPTSTPSYALKCIYEYAKLFSLPCICTLDNMLGGVSAQSEISFKMGLSHVVPFIEEMEFSKFFCLAHHYQTPTLLQALSEENVFTQSKSHSWIKNEVSIHHLLLNEESILNYNPWAKLTPPLGTTQTQSFFLNELANIDMLTSLHREFSQSSKGQTFENASSGVDCLEFYFSLLFTELVCTKRLSLQELSAKTSFNQAQFLKLNQGEISIGKDASLILFDPNDSFEMSHPLYGNKKLLGKIKGFVSPKTGFQVVNNARI